MKKLDQEKLKLSQTHLITSPKELQDELLSIDKKSVSTTKKKALKIDLLRNQVQIRKKVLGQSVRITFTANRKQRPVAAIAKEQGSFIGETSPCLPSEYASFIMDPTTLVSKRIKHKFQDKDNSYRWYLGTVIAYQPTDKTHCILYDGEEEACYFDLTVDFLTGDLILIDKSEHC